SAANGLPLGERMIRVVRLFDASPERLYRMWTDPDELTSWLPHMVEGSLAVGTTSTLVWHDHRISGEMLEAEPYRRIRQRWTTLPDGASPIEIQVTISPFGYGSRLELQVGPYDLDSPDGLSAWSQGL